MTADQSLVNAVRDPAKDWIGYYLSFQINKSNEAADVHGLLL